MKPFNLGRLLPHEIFFGLFLFITWIRFATVLGLGSPESLLYLALIFVNLGLISACERMESPARWRWRLLFYVAAMNIVFIHMKSAIPKIQPLRMDSFLQRVDSALIGRNLSLRLESLTHPALTDFFSACYILFFPYLAVSLILYYSGDLGLLKKFATGLFTIYGIGFLGYSLLPAVGPALHMPSAFSVPLQGGWITNANVAVVSKGSNGVDVFPSLHCAVSSFLLFFDRRHRPWRFKIYLIPAVGLWISTIYLRYHYFVDLLCGFALSAFALRLAHNFERTSVEPSPQH